MIDYFTLTNLHLPKYLALFKFREKNLEKTESRACYQKVEWLKRMVRINELKP
jgi:hypothetical protein